MKHPKQVTFINRTRSNGSDLTTQQLSSNPRHQSVIAAAEKWLDRVNHLTQIIDDDNSENSEKINAMNALAKVGIGTKIEYKMSSRETLSVVGTVVIELFGSEGFDAFMEAIEEKFRSMQ